MTPLENWLLAATHGLSAESAARVRAEIQEHYQSAHEAALELAVPSREADRAAVAALGDPISANRQYRRVLLTAREANFLFYMTLDVSSLPAPRVTKAKWLARILVAEGVAGVALSTWRNPVGWYLCAVIVGLLLSELLPVDTLACGRAYRWAKWTALTGGAALTGWYGAPWAPLGVILGSAYVEYRRISIRRKLPVGQWPKRLYR